MFGRLFPAITAWNLKAFLQKFLTGFGPAVDRVVRGYGEKAAGGGTAMWWNRITMLLRWLQHNKGFPEARFSGMFSRVIRDSMQCFSGNGDPAVAL